MSVIRTKRLLLRPFESEDLNTAHAYASDPDNTKYMIHLPNRTIQETERFLKRVISEWEKETPQFYEYAIVLDGKHIGAVSVYMDDQRQEGELGWIIHKDYQGNGYASEAAKAVMDMAYNKLHLKKIVAHCDQRNEPSFRVMQKIGLSLERDDGLRCYKDSEEEFPEFMYSLELN